MGAKKQLFLLLMISAVFLLTFIKTLYATVTVQLSDSNGSDSFNIINSGTISVFNILSNGRVGIGTTTPSAMLCIEGSSTVSSTALCITGTVTVVGSFNASSYSGDGSGLTGISSDAIASNIEF